MDQLSSIDASFLHLETPETPMHVGSLMLFELPEDYQGDYYEDVKAMLGKHEMVQALEIRNELPKTPVGTISKKDLYDEEERKTAAA